MADVDYDVDSRERGYGYDCDYDGRKVSWAIEGNCGL